MQYLSCLKPVYWFKLDERYSALRKPINDFDDEAYRPLAQGLSETDVRQRIAETLYRIGLTGYDQRSPHHLSHGDKKWIVLVTVLTMRPVILALDEPTSNLDPRFRKHLDEILGRVDGAMVMATHDLGGSPGNVLPFSCPG